ncbi:hypothetical protein [Magnetospirillum molischianum]|nr:hypothetical protein [Magnetospirillum molischianum]
MADIIEAMTMLPHLDCTIAKRAGNDRHGQPVYGEILPAHVGVVKFDVGADKTSVRSDSSASRGKGDEPQADARLLFPAWGVQPSVGDIVELQGARLRVQTVNPRLAVLGRLDHWQVDCVIAGAG